MATAEQVRAIFMRYFATHPEAGALWQALMGYESREPSRVQLAILKLSEGDAQLLLHYLHTAQSDYRDVLAWAEYPEQLDSGKTAYNASEEDYQAVLKRDRQQYEDWLAEHLPAEEPGDDG